MYCFRAFRATIAVRDMIIDAVVKPQARSRHKKEMIIPQAACICYMYMLCFYILRQGPSEQPHPAKQKKRYAQCLLHLWREKRSHNGRPTKPESETPRAWLDGHRVANCNWVPKKCKATIHHLVLLVRVDLEGHGLLVGDGQFGPS